MLTSIQSSPAKIDRSQRDNDKEVRGEGASPSLDSTSRNSAHSDSRLFNHYLPKIFAKHRPPTSLTHAHSHNRSHTPSTPTTAEIQGCQRSHSINLKTLFRRPTPKPNSIRSSLSNDTHGPRSEDEEADTSTSPDQTTQAAIDVSSKSPNYQESPYHHSVNQTEVAAQEYDEVADEDAAGGGARQPHRMQATEITTSQSRPPSMISSPQAYAMRHLKYHDLESLNDFVSDVQQSELHTDERESRDEDERQRGGDKINSVPKGVPAVYLPAQAVRQPIITYVDEEVSAEHASLPVWHHTERSEAREVLHRSTSMRIGATKQAACPKWMPHPLSLETYTSIATSPGPLYEINSTADSQQPYPSQPMPVSADEYMASPAKRLHRFLNAAATGKMLCLSQIQGESDQLQPVEEKTERGLGEKRPLWTENMKDSSRTSPLNSGSMSASTAQINDDDAMDEAEHPESPTQDEPQPEENHTRPLTQRAGQTTKVLQRHDLPSEHWTYRQNSQARGRSILAQSTPASQLSSSSSQSSPCYANTFETNGPDQRIVTVSAIKSHAMDAGGVEYQSSTTVHKVDSLNNSSAGSGKVHDAMNRSLTPQVLDLEGALVAKQSHSSSGPQNESPSSPHADMSNDNIASGSPSSGAAFPLASPSISSSANFPISSPFLQWMVNSSTTAQAVCTAVSSPDDNAAGSTELSMRSQQTPQVRGLCDGSSETTRHSVSASPSRVHVQSQKQVTGLGRMSPVAEESELLTEPPHVVHGSKRQGGSTIQSPSSAGQNSSSQFETANEEFISAQETQDGEGVCGMALKASATAAEATHELSSSASRRVMRGTEKETVLVKSRNGESTEDGSSIERKRHKSPVQRIVSALTKRLFTAPESQSRSCHTTDQWARSNEQSSVCRERLRRQERMKEAMARALDEPRSPQEDSSEASGFDMKETCNDLKLRCFPKLLTPVRASTCTGTTRAASQQSAARHRHISTFSQPTPPSSRVYNPRGESPPTCSCRLGPSSAGDTSSLGNSLKFAMPQPRTASSIGASSWRRCYNAPIIQSRGIVHSSRPCSSSSSYQSSDSSLPILSPPKGGMRTLVGVFSAVEDAALRKYYDCLEDLKRRGDPLAATLSNDIPSMEVACFDRRDECARCSQYKWHGNKAFIVRDGSLMTDDTTQDRSTAEACMEVIEDESSRSDDDDEEEYSNDDEEYHMMDHDWLPSSRGVLEDSLHNNGLHVPAIYVMKRGSMTNGLSDLRQLKRHHHRPYFHPYDDTHFHGALCAVKSAPALDARAAVVTEEEAERRLRRFLSHVVMKRRLKRIKLLQDSATKIQRWYRSQRQMGRFTLDDDLSSSTLTESISSRALPPPKHKILADGRILNVPRGTNHESSGEILSYDESGSRRLGLHTAKMCDQVARRMLDNHDGAWIVKTRSNTGSRGSHTHQKSISRRHLCDAHHLNIISRGGLSDSSSYNKGVSVRAREPKPSECTSGSLMTDEDWSSEADSCLWRDPRLYGRKDCYRERDIAVRIYSRPLVKVTMNRSNQSRF